MSSSTVSAAPYRRAANGEDCQPCDGASGFSGSNELAREGSGAAASFRRRARCRTSSRPGLREKVPRRGAARLLRPDVAAAISRRRSEAFMNGGSEVAERLDRSRYRMLGR